MVIGSKLHDTVLFLEGLGYKRVNFGTKKLEELEYSIEDKVERIRNDQDDCFLAVKYKIYLGAGIGYSGFTCVFYFDVDGKFLGHGCWE